MSTLVLSGPISHNPGRDIGQADPVQRMYRGFMAQYLTKQSTYRAYEEDLKNWFCWCESRQLYPLAVTRTDLDVYIAWMQMNPAGWSESTIQRRLGTALLMYRWAHEEELILKNPGVRITRPKVDHDKQRCTFLPPVEFAILLKHVRAHGTIMEQAYIALVGLRGLRISEACGLNVTDFAEYGGLWTLSFIGKGSKARRIRVPGAAIRPIQNAIGDRLEGPILLNQAGNRLNRVNGDHMLKRLARAAGVDSDISNHSLRRSFVTSAKASGASYDDIAEAVGHVSTATTRRYDRLIGSLHRDASDGVAGFLTNLAG